MKPSRWGVSGTGFGRKMKKFSSSGNQRHLS